LPPKLRPCKQSSIWVTDKIDEHFALKGLPTTRDGEGMPIKRSCQRTGFTADMTIIARRFDKMPTAFRPKD
jgi:hypothetical protein